MGRLFKAALSSVGTFWHVLISSRIEERSRVLESRGDSPEAVSDGLATTAPASGHPDDVCECGHRIHDSSLCAACDCLGWFPDRHEDTSAVRPPAAVDDPAAGDLPPSAAGSPDLQLVAADEDYSSYVDRVVFDANARAEGYRASLLKMAGLDVEVVDDAREFDWERWAIPAIREVLTEWHPFEERNGAVRCDTRGGRFEFDDERDWLGHVAPLIAAHIHKAAAALR